MSTSNPAIGHVDIGNHMPAIDQDNAHYDAPARGSAEAAAAAARAARGDSSPAPKSAADVAGLNAPRAAHTSSAPGTVADTAINSPSTDAQINAMIAALTTAGGDLSNVVQSRGPDLKLNTADGEVEVLRQGSHDANMVQSDLYDDGRDLFAARDAIVKGVETLEAQFAEVKYDPATGKQEFVVKGAEREVLARRISQARESAAYDIERLNAIQAQRVARSSKQAGVNSEDIVKAAFAKGDPARVKLLADAIARAEAEEVARAIIASRRGSR